MSRIPETVRASVIAAIYSHLDEMKWESPGIDRNSAYSALLDDPDIGERLTPYMTLWQARVWIKDGPAKEYSRALEGRSPYAKYTSRTLPGPHAVVSASCGDGWALKEGTVVDKPMRCVATNGTRSRTVMWGDESKFSDLYQAASRERIAGNDVLLVITRPGNAPVAQIAWNGACDLAALIGAGITSIVYSPVMRTSGRPTP
ncbi:hypothetical protein [Demequina lutea]|uniref:Uncharacterized protein n=1 Tax=Demequina lutea TaxID=431489 RepID=A0A7Z0CJK2_9MICO|nr:hypothetical protein [Demequina lutea]NYI40862.1 hypothetical protein [Demequina lutea]